jgi:hypothetical protein
MTFDPEIAACIDGFANAGLGGNEQTDVDDAPAPEVETKPTQMLLFDLRRMTARRELSPENLTEMAVRWRTAADQRRAPIRFAIIAGDLLPQAEQLATELHGSLIEARVFATKGDAQSAGSTNPAASLASIDASVVRERGLT